jgi:hypothetical protein
MNGSDGTGGRVPSPRHESSVRVRRPCVLLVRIEEGEEPGELGLSELFVQVLRTRHAVQACHRMGIVRPLVVVVGELVRADDIGLLDERAAEIGAEVLQLNPLVSRALRAWMRRALETAMARRERAADRARRAMTSA